MICLPIEKRRRVRALVKLAGAEFNRGICGESDLDVLREVNFQLNRWPNSPRTLALEERLANLTGKQVNRGRSGYQRWVGRGRVAS